MPNKNKLIEFTSTFPFPLGLTRDPQTEHAVLEGLNLGLIFQIGPAGSAIGINCDRFSKDTISVLVRQ